MTTSLSQTAYERIQAMLLREDIVSGAKVSEEKLAAKLGISRTPVRDAIRRLQQEGVLHQRPSSGTYVASPDRHSLIETYEVRMALESFAVQKAARRMSSTDLEQLDNYCHDMLDAIRAFRDSHRPVLDGPLLRDFLVADLSFHMLLMRSVNNPYMLKLMGDAHVRNRIFSSQSHNRSLRHVAYVWLYHARVSRAIRRRQGAKARRWLLRHMQMSLREALRQFDCRTPVIRTEKPAVDVTLKNLMTSCRDMKYEYESINKMEKLMTTGDIKPENENLALEAPPILTKLGKEYGDRDRMFQGIPGIERSPKGRLWATWYGGGDTEGPENYVMLATSENNGLNWTSPILVVDPHTPARAYDPTLWLDPRGRLWLFWAQARQWWDGRGGVWAMMTENPDSPTPEWSSPVRIADGVMMNKPTVLKNGTWLAPIAIWQVNEIHPDVKAPAGAGVYQSTDNGAHWSFLGNADVPAVEHDFEEHMIVELQDGKLRMLVRTRYGIAQSESTDGGKTWSVLGPSMFEHPNSRFFIRRLNSGHLLMVKHTPRNGIKQRSHLTAHLSTDDGVTWPASLLLDERFGVSYPDGTQSPDGRIYIIYDYDRMGEKNILLAEVTEEDILAGSVIDPHSKLRIVVNQAYGKNPRHQS